MIINPKYYVLCVVLIVALLVSWFVIGAEKDKIIAVCIEGGILLIIIARMVQIKLKKVKVGPTFDEHGKVSTYYIRNS